MLAQNRMIRRNHLRRRIRQGKFDFPDERCPVGCDPVIGRKFLQSWERSGDYRPASAEVFEEFHWKHLVRVVIDQLREQGDVDTTEIIWELRIRSPAEKVNV